MQIKSGFYFKTSHNHDSVYQIPSHPTQTISYTTARIQHTPSPPQETKPRPETETPLPYSSDPTRRLFCTTTTVHGTPTAAATTAVRADRVF